MSLDLSSGFTRAQWSVRGKGETDSINCNHKRSSRSIGTWFQHRTFHNRIQWISEQRWNNNCTCLFPGKRRCTRGARQKCELSSWHIIIYLSFHFGLNVCVSLCLWWRVLTLLFKSSRLLVCPGRKGTRYAIKFCSCETFHFNILTELTFPSLRWVSSPLLFSHRGTEAWLVPRGGRETKERRDRKERKWATRGWWCPRKYGIVCVCSAYSLTSV